MELQTTSFVKPYPQAALNGALGLTSLDIARAIGMRHDLFMRNLCQRKYWQRMAEAGFTFPQICGKVPGSGRPTEIMIFDIEMSKAMVVLSRTKIGFEYLRHLIDCERIVDRAREEGMPLLKKEIETLRQRVELLLHKKAAPRGKHRHRFIAGFRTITDLFGITAEVPVYRELALSEMTNEEQRAWEAMHNARVAKGAAAKTEGLLNHEVRPGRRAMRLIAGHKKDLAII